MSLFIALLIISFIITPLTTSPFEPIPHAEVLDEILSNKVLNGSDSNDPVFEYLFGNNSNTVNSSNENLDINILDSDNVKKIIGIAKNKAILRDVINPIHAAYNDTDQRFLIEQTFNLMKQSIYGTRYRLQNTKKFRYRYRNNPVYHIALMYGAFLQMLLKMDNYLGNMVTFHETTHFIWYLIIYEKLLAKHTDAYNIVQRIFMLHYQIKDDNSGDSD